MKKASLNAEKQSSGEREPWPRAKLGEVCEITPGTRVRRKDSTGGEYPVYGGGGATFVWPEYNREDACIVSRFAMSEECVRVVRGKFFLNDSGLSVCSKKTTLLNDEFLRWYLLGKQPEIYALGRGAAQRNLDMEQFPNLKIPLPPLAVQRAVVARLEGEMKAVGRLEAGFREMAKAAEAAFIAELAEAFAAGAGAGEDGGNVRVERVERVEENSRVEHKEHKEPGLVGAGVPARPRGASGGSCVSASAGEPAEGDFFNAEKGERGRRGEGEPWPRAKLGEVFDIARGGSPRPIKEYLTTAENGLNWIKIGDAVKGSKYITAVHEKIKPEGLHKTRRVYKGDLLLSNSMSFGQPYILGVDGCIHDGWLVLHPKQEVSQDFFFYLLSSPLVKQQFARLAVGGVVQNLNSDKVRGVEIPLPPLAVQRLIVSRLEAAAGRRARIVALADEGAAAAADLRRAILKEAFEPT